MARWTGTHCEGWRCSSIPENKCDGFVSFFFACTTPIRSSQVLLWLAFAGYLALSSLKQSNRMRLFPHTKADIPPLRSIFWGCVQPCYNIRIYAYILRESTRHFWLFFHQPFMRSRVHTHTIARHCFQTAQHFKGNSHAKLCFSGESIAVTACYSSIAQAAVHVCVCAAVPPCVWI